MNRSWLRGPWYGVGVHMHRANLEKSHKHLNESFMRERYGLVVCGCGNVIIEKIKNRGGMQDLVGRV